MNASELHNQFTEGLRERRRELEEELALVVSLQARGGIERQATSEDRAPRKRAVWTPERRKEQSRRMKRLHREGKFR